ncbi:MAG TPA: aminotransferase class I/II-fold pyridoxal phosphate-dependent enzyme [Saprospiraceae bacterium]|nr:aminotransferase class I/II-fold pyridoxal phosphate-dependent enzyme [Saprospiraceae bacterium]
MAGKISTNIPTICARSPRDLKNTKPHQLPIYASSTFEFDSIEDSIEAFQKQPHNYVYTRYGNPTIDAVAQKIAHLESLDATGLLCSSGMAAIHIPMISLLKAGDAVLTQPILYGGTVELFEKVLRPQGIHFIYADMEDENSLRDLISKNKNIKLNYVETPCNPTLACIDIGKLKNLRDEFKIKLIVDNTFSTPYNQKALQLGADIVIHSTTKFLHGHGVSTGGVIISEDVQLMNELIWPNLKLTGANSNVMDAWLIHLGLKTLHVRMQRHNENANALAHFLHSHPMVNSVNYPGLKNFVGHEVAKKQMSGFGAMLSFEVKGSTQQTIQCLNALSMASIAPSLGETETMVLHPATSSHMKMDPGMRKKYGISDSLIRVSVGLEDISDIIYDFEQALTSLSQ